MKKIIIITLLSFLLCGCTAEVNIDISDNQIKEVVSIDAYPDTYYTKNQLKQAFRTYIPTNYEVQIVDTMPDEKEKGITYYNRTLKDIGNGYRFIYNYDFNINNYSTARTLKGAWKSSTIQLDKKEKEILISTDNNEIMYFNEYPSLTKIKINITTAYKVKEHNADTVSGNVYTWNFDKNTKNNIYLLLSTEPKTNSNSNQDNEEKKKNQNEKKESTSPFEKFLNEHPFIVAICSILLFIILVSIVSKLTKHKY